MFHKIQSHAKKHEHKIVKFGIAFIVVVVVLYFLFPVNKTPQPISQDQTISATFDCQDGKSIKAEFTGQIVNLTLSDGRSLALDHAISADGARYTNRDESIVFWNTGNTAFITEGSATTYQDCVDNPQGN